MISQPLSQWQRIQQNIGTWQGSFTQFSPEGEQLKNTPSVLILEETAADKTMQLTLKRFPVESTPSITKRSFSAPGPAPYVYFFETGAFSQGSAQWHAFSQFGAEMSLKVGDRRVRFVIMYDATEAGTSNLKYVTLIRETQAGGTPFSEPDMTPAQLIGHWSGTIAVLHATMEPETTGHSECFFDDTALKHINTFDEKSETLSLANSNAGLPLGKIMLLKDDLTYQLMPLPNGAYCLVPQTIAKESAFQIEVGWLRENGDRTRLVRYYDDRSVWTHTALIEDRLSDR